MKKIYLFFISLLCSTLLNAQTLFTYGTNTVSKDEFLRAYNKNKTPVTDKAKSLQDYLDLYTKFKLKVKAAEELRFDTLQQLQFDLQSFRTQVEEGYLNDERGMNMLMEEALQRSQKDIHLLHFFIPINGKADPEDTLKASKAMTLLQAELKKGRKDYSKIAEDITKTTYELKYKDLGYITALTIPYLMENVAYNLQPGAFSNVFKTKNAIHVFINDGERKAVGKWKIAQILLAIPPDATPETVKLIEAKADSLYNLVAKGKDFGETAKQWSEDKITYLNGGEMPEFGTGKFSLNFETKVFELKKDGDISKPIFTGDAYHIVKRISQKPTPADKSDEGFMYGLKQQIMADNRVSIAKDLFLKDVLVKIAFKRNPALKDAELFRYADSVTESKTIGNNTISNKILFSFAKSNVKGSDWLNFVKDYKLNTDVYKGENNKELLEKYISTTAFEYYRKHLDEYSADFRYQMQEFKEGNMLFEIMEKNIWSKASSDTVGLKKYYEEHKSKYQWAESASILLFNCTNQKAAEEAQDALNRGKDWHKIAEESDGRIQSDSGRYEVSQIQLPAGTTAKEGLLTPPVVNNTDNTASFVKILKIYPANQQRTFEEARGLVINEYQTFLEEKWIAELKQKYPIKVNDAVFQSMIK